MTSRVVGQSRRNTKKLGQLHTLNEDPDIDPFDAVYFEAVNTQFIDPRAPKAKRFSLYLVLAGTVALVIGLYYNNLFSPRTIISSKLDITTDFHTDKELEIENIANDIILIKVWTIADTNKFIDKWKKLDYESRVRVRGNPWFQHLAALTETRLKKYQRLNQASKGSHEKSLAAVTKLAANIGTSETESTKFKITLDKVAAELADVEAKKIYGSLPPIKPDNITTTDNSATTTINNHIKPKVTTHSKSLTQNRLSQHKIGTPTKVTLKKPTSLNGADISELLEQYTDAYKTGNTDTMLALFGETQEKSTKKTRDLRSKFNTIFKSSTQRQITLKKIIWQYNDGTALGAGEISALLTHRNDLSKHAISADARIEIAVAKNKLYIANFEIQNANIILPDSFLITTSNNKKPVMPATPTAGELQDIVTRLVSAYEKGDIESFQSLFTKNAKTNSFDNLTQITKDYMALFNTTTERQMFIQDLDWSFGENHAKGIGNMNVLVTTRKDEKSHSVAGKIQIIAKRINRKVYISHLYNVSNEN